MKKQVMGLPVYSFKGCCEFVFRVAFFFLGELVSGGYFAFQCGFSCNYHIYLNRSPGCLFHFGTLRRVLIRGWVLISSSGQWMSESFNLIHCMIMSSTQLQFLPL